MMKKLVSEWEGPSALGTEPKLLKYYQFAFKSDFDWLGYKCLLQ